MTRAEKLANLLKTCPTVIGVEYRKSTAVAFVQFDKGKDGKQGAKKLFSFLRSNLNSTYHEKATDETVLKLSQTTRKKELVGYRAIEIKNLPVSVVDYLEKLVGKEDFGKKLGSVLGRMLHRTDKENYKAVWGQGIATGELKPFTVYLSNEDFTQLAYLTKEIPKATEHSLVYYAILKYIRNREMYSTEEVRIPLRKSIRNKLDELPMEAPPLFLASKMWHKIESDMMSSAVEVPTEQSMDNYFAFIRASEDDCYSSRLIRPPIDKWRMLLNRYPEDFLKKLVAYRVSNLFCPPNGEDAMKTQPQLFL